MIRHYLPLVPIAIPFIVAIAAVIISFWPVIMTALS
jgi:hypothetical protein